jgi:SAM-dependent methyltransferase
MAQQLGVNRSLVAGWFLQGEGIEIGPLHQPLTVPSDVQVRYVDRLSVADLRKQYPELQSLPLTHPDVIDDGEKLANFDAASQDFIIACHFLEHCQDPIGALQTFRRVLKPDGVLYLVIPDKTYTFDKNRPSTPLEHLIRDHEEGPLWSREGHYREYAEKVDLAPDDAAITERAQKLMHMDYSIHFHVWTKGELLHMLTTVDERYELGFTLRCFVDNGEEGIYILSKPVTAGLPAKVLSRNFRLQTRLLMRFAERIGRAALRGDHGSHPERQR